VTWSELTGNVDSPDWREGFRGEERSVVNRSRRGVKGMGRRKVPVGGRGPGKNLISALAILYFAMRKGREVYL